MRIAMLIATPGTPGGMEQHTRDLACALVHRGHDVHVLAHPGYRATFTAPIQFHPLPMTLSRRHPWLNYRLRKTLRTLQPDICHAQGNKAAHLLSHYRAGRFSPPCLRVGTVHGIKSSHQAFAALDGVIGVSKTILASLDHRHTCCIYNGIAPVPANLGPHSAPLCPAGFQTPLVLAVGRLEPVKGFDNLLQAWHQSRASGHLVIIGDGSERHRLMALRDRLGLQQSVTLAGHRGDVRYWLTQADLCVISSQREGMPYVMVEALQAGCPILSTPVGGLAEWLPPKHLAADSSAAALATLLRSHLPDLNTLRQHQAPQIERARRELTIESMTTLTENFYTELASSG